MPEETPQTSLEELDRLKIENSILRVRLLEQELNAAQKELQRANDSTNTLIQDTMQQQGIEDDEEDVGLSHERSAGPPQRSLIWMLISKVLPSGSSPVAAGATKWSIWLTLDPA